MGEVEGKLANLICLPTPEDLIILKAVAHRPKDLLDIRTLIETGTSGRSAHPALGEGIRQCAGQAGTVEGHCTLVYE